MRTVPVPPPVRRSFEDLRSRSREAWASIGDRVRPRRKSVPTESPVSNRPIVMIHGLNVPRQVLIPIGIRLERQYNRPCHNLSYPIHGRSIPVIAQYIADQIRELGLTEYDAVTHSMGGVVLRWAVANHELPPLKRAVMIAPPNAGAWMADHLSRRMKWLFPFVFGEAGMQLRRGPRGVAARAGTLHGTEVGIIAGGSGKPTGVRNWFGIPGDCDGTVAVEETILPGMKDFTLLNANHSAIILKAETARLVDHFLTHGVFRHRKQGHHD
ncbi:hypothetical protein GC173_02080 [bacterium]|nr:hypothetical protein [bacterium]